MHGVGPGPPTKNCRGPMKSESAPTQPQDGATFCVTERVRWADVDRNGIIFFGAYARFIDVAEGEFYRSLGFTHAELEKLGVDLTRVHVEFDFFKPARLDEELSLRARPTGVGLHSARLKIDVYRSDDEALLAEITMVSACVDRNGKSAPIPPAFAEALRARTTR